MNIFRLAFELFLLYLLYKLIFDFIIPVVKTTQQVKKQFGDMSARMQEKMNEQQKQATTVNSTSRAKGPRNDDYIEYEEVE